MDSVFKSRVSDKVISERCQRILTVVPLKRPSKYDMAGEKVRTARPESQDVE